MSLAVVMLTYAPNKESPRHEYAKITARSLVKNLKYSGDIHWHIATDGTPDELVREYEFPDPSVSCSPRLGYGANYNIATQTLHWGNEYLLMVEDDWELLKPLDLDILTKALDEGLGCIRLGYLGWTQELKGKLVKKADHTFIEFDPDSSEPHVWSGHPRIETREFQRLIGPWPEGVDPGTTEFIVATRKETRLGPVAWPLDIGVNASQQCANLFAHIGAVQAREDQS